MSQLMHDPRISLHLLLLPSSSARASASSHVDEGAPKPLVPRTIQPRKKARASAKARANCPDELKGFGQFDDKDTPICWAFNQRGDKGWQMQERNV